MPLAKVVALTGSTGFIGSNILKSLLANNIRIKILVRNPNKISIKHPNIEIIPGDLHSRSSLLNLTSNVDAIIHCAGRVKGATASDFANDNIQGTKNILFATVKNNITRFILISSLSAREPTISDYAHSKYASEAALMQSQLKQWTIIRPPAMYGPGDTELKPVFDWMKRGILWVPGSLNQQFSLLHVADLSQLIIDQLSSSNQYGKTLEPDDGNRYNWQKIQQISSVFFNKNIIILRLPSFLLSLVAHLNVLLSKPLNYSPMLTPGKVRELLHDDWVSQDASSIANWRPKVDLKIGLGTLYSSDEVN
ncbi:MAG: NAD(P)H-binding protein [Gammaproteobacteria bacterium]|nr:NAD(P)H-binding protein [Gammaproteobacteria bacterium]